VENAGILKIEPFATLVIANTVTLHGAGTVELVQPGGEQLSAAIDGDASGVYGELAAGTLINNGNTIEGTGQIGEDDGSLTFENTSGTVDANVSGWRLGIDTGNPITNGGLFEATNGGTLYISDPVTGTGSFAIGADSTLEFGNSLPSGAAVSFAGSTGLLQLDAPAGANLVVSGFTGTAANAAQSDEVELSGVWSVQSEATTDSGSNVVLDLQNGNQTVSLTFDNLSASNLVVSNDESDTFIFDPPAGSMSSNSLSQHASIGGPGGDTFLFHPGMGTETISNFNPRVDNIELDHFANVQNMRQLAADITSNAHGDAVIELGHNDSITVAGMTAAQLQAHLQSFVHLH
jgi:hypothetical protein